MTLLWEDTDKEGYHATCSYIKTNICKGAPLPCGIYRVTVEKGGKSLKKDFYPMYGPEYGDGLLGMDVLDMQASLRIAESLATQLEGVETHATTDKK